MPKPFLSAVLIVKDEEKNLPRCLCSLQGWCDEIVVVDTGSTDGSVAVAMDVGARVEYFPWNGNEADARNCAVSHARGEWLLLIDADEEVSDELRRELTEILPRLTEAPHIRSCSVLWENHYLGGETSSTRILRIARREGFVFAGGIHPTATYQPETHPLLGALRHYGYQWTPETRERKARHIIDHLQPYLADGHPSFDRWCQYLSALTLIGEHSLFVQAWEWLAHYTTEERIASAATPAWLENSANFFRYFSCLDNFESGAVYADEILAAHPQHLTSRFYRLQRAVKKRDWGNVLHDGNILRERLGSDPGPNNPSWPIFTPAARAWLWLARTQLSGGESDPPAWLVDGLTLPTYLFDNRAPAVPPDASKAGAELLQTLIQAETHDRCGGTVAALRLLGQCLQQWPRLNWLRVGLDHLQPGEPFRLDQLAARTVHLT